MYKRILLSLVVIWGLSQALAVTITSNKVESYAERSGTLDNKVSDTFTGTSIPTSPAVTLKASFASGVVSSETTVEYTGSGDQVTFSNTFKHENIANYEEESGSLGNMRFTVDSDVSYELSALYDFVGDREKDQEEEIYLWVYFLDETVPSLLVEIGQTSTTTPLELSYSGTLLAGHFYSFNFRAETEELKHDLDAFDIVNSKGHLTLKIGGGAPDEGNGDPDEGNGTPDDGTVPDRGTTAALLGLSLLGLAAARHRVAK